MSDVSDIPMDATDDSPVALDDAATIVADDLTIDTEPEPYVVDVVSLDDYNPTGLDDPSIGVDDDTAASAVLPATEDFVPQTQIHLGDDGQLVDITPTNGAGEQAPAAPEGAITYDGTTPIPAEHNPIGGPIPQNTVSLPADDGLPANGDGPLMPSDIGAAVPPSGDTTTPPPGPFGGDPTAVQTAPPFPGSGADDSGLTPPDVDPGSQTGDPTGAPIIGSVADDPTTGPDMTGVPTGDTTIAPPGPVGGDDPTAMQTPPPDAGTPADTSGLTMPAAEAATAAPEPGDRVGPFDATKLPAGYLERLAHDPSGVPAEQLLREYMKEDGHDPDAYLATDAPAAPTDPTTNPTTATTPVDHGMANPTISPEQGVGLIGQLTGPSTPELAAQLQGAVVAAAAEGGSLTVAELAGIFREHSADFGMGTSGPETAATAAGITKALDEGRSVYMFVERDTTTTTTTVHDSPVELATFRAFDAQASTFTLDTNSGEELEMHADDLSKWLTAVGLNAPAGPAGPVLPVDSGDGDGGGMSGLQMVGIGAGVLVPAAAGAALLARRRQARS